MIIGACKENGKPNAREIIVDLSAHKTADNILKTKGFTVSISDLEHLAFSDEKKLK